jgi:hypothetical protein
MDFNELATSSKNMLYVRGKNGRTGVANGWSNDLSAYNSNLVIWIGNSTFGLQLAIAYDGSYKKARTKWGTWQNWFDI